MKIKTKTKLVNGLTDKQKKIAERNNKIRVDYEEYMALGSDATAVYNELARQYGLTPSSIVRIVCVKQERVMRKRKSK